jgi:hypothetical protein
VPSSCPITFQSISQRLLAEKPSNFFISPFPLKGRVSVNVYLKSKEHWKIVKTTSGSSPTTGLSNNITLSRSPSRVTVPLNYFPMVGVGLIAPLQEKRNVFMFSCDWFCRVDVEFDTAVLDEAAKKWTINTTKCYILSIYILRYARTQRSYWYKIKRQKHLCISSYQVLSLPIALVHTLKLFQYSFWFTLIIQTATIFCATGHAALRPTGQSSVPHFCTMVRNAELCSDYTTVPYKNHINLV